MGRTLRRRRRNKQPDGTVPKKEKVDHSIVKMVQWMAANGWEATSSLTPYNFQSTGRGLMTKKCIKNGDILVKIPGKLLITVKAVYDSSFGWVFSRGKYFTTQQVLSCFLVFEKHLVKKSFWADYIAALPESIHSPVFCSAEVLEYATEEVRDKVLTVKTNVIEQYDDFMNTLIVQDICSHCEKPLIDIFNLDDFTWAWFIVNSRAVYISPERNTDHSILLSDSNCLALAPYLDMLNHSNDVQVQAFIHDSDDSYQIKTLVPFKKYDQVFIHYGGHSNIKLLLDYGFILPMNMNDTIALSFDDVFKTIIDMFPDKISSSKQKYKFLKVHDLLSNIYCCTDGLSWTAKVLIYVLLTPEHMEPRAVQQKVFCSDFNIKETKEISTVGKKLLEKKQILIKQELDDMRKCFDTLSDQFLNESFRMIINLYQEYTYVLNKVDEILSKNIDESL